MSEAQREKIQGEKFHRAKTVLVVIDVINDFKFEGRNKLAKFALPAAR